MLIDDFLSHLGTRSAETLRAYRADVGRFLSFLEATHTTLEAISASTIEQYMQHLDATSKTGRPMSAASIGRRLAVISSYLDFLYVRTNGAVRNQVRDVRRPRVHNILPRALDDCTLATLMDGITNVRDKALLALYVASGLRLEETRQLNLNSISRQLSNMPDLIDRTLGVSLVRGNECKSRNFLIDEGPLNLLLAYMRIRGTSGSVALFLSNRKVRLSRRNIQYILDRWCGRLGLAHSHIHALRHTFAHAQVAHNMSALVLQQLMGHQSFTVTQRYFSVRPERIAAEYFAAQEAASDGRVV